MGLETTFFSLPLLLAGHLTVFTAATDFLCAELNTVWLCERDNVHDGWQNVCLIVRPDQSLADGSPPGVSRFEIRSIGQFSEHQSQVVTNHSGLYTLLVSCSLCCIVSLSSTTELYSSVCTSSRGNAQSSSVHLQLAKNHTSLHW